MFSMKECECVGFESIWRVKKVYTAGSSQTQYVSHESATNTQLLVTAETQTDLVEIPETCDVDMQRLSEWLTSVYPTVSKELNESIYSQAFKHYRLERSRERPTANLLQSFTVCPESDTTEDVQTPRVSGLSWNSTGNTLAVARNYPHKMWCYHAGLVSLYTFDRYGRFPEAPAKKLVTETCVSVVSFHPKLPHIIAAGTYTGDIILWNIQNDDLENVICKLSAHEENITQMSWIADIDAAKNLIMATSSLDGCLSLWNFSMSAPYLNLKHKYKIKSPVLPKSTRVLQIPEEVAKKVERGVLCFDFSPYVPDIFIVGAEGGLLTQCSLLGTVPLKGSTPEVPVSDPIYKYFVPHESEIIKVQFSPNRREMFLSCSASGELRIYVLDQDEPAQILFIENPLLDISFIPFHEKIIAGCSLKGGIQIFGLRSGDTMQTLGKDGFDDANVGAMTRMELNRARVSTVAVGSSDGILQLWSIPWSSYNQEY